MIMSIKCDAFELVLIQVKELHWHEPDASLRIFELEKFVLICTLQEKIQLMSRTTRCDDVL